MQSFNIHTSLNSLQNEIKSFWANELSTNPFFLEVISNPVSKELYIAYMRETYHYTSHNARNQALVGVAHDNLPDGYRKFCFDHAAEETGHENMALHDVISLGASADSIRNSKPLAETEHLVSYLYSVSKEGSPYRRLGYSFWAESVYEHINPVLSKIKSDLDLAPKNMTFFVAHSDIDAEHAEEVREMIVRYVRSKEDFESLRECALESLRMTMEILTATLAIVKGAKK